MDDVNFFQPRTENPHNKSGEIEEVVFDSSVLNQGKAYATDGFVDDPVFELISASYVSGELESSFQEDGVYFMGYIGPEGSKPLVLADEESFIIDEEWSPDKEMPDRFSPIDLVESTRYSQDLKIGIMDYEVMDLEGSVNTPDLEDYWSEDCDLSKSNNRYIVAPGLKRPYRERIDQML